MENRENTTYNQGNEDGMNARKCNPIGTKEIIGIGLFVVFTVLFIVGYTNGEVQTVFIKASNICLECIGIG